MFKCINKNFKFIIIFLIILFSVSCVNALENDTDLSASNETDDIKTVSLIDYDKNVDTYNSDNDSNLTQNNTYNIFSKDSIYNELIPLSFRTNITQITLSWALNNSFIKVTTISGEKFENIINIDYNESSNFIYYMVDSHLLISNYPNTVTNNLYTWSSHFSENNVNNVLIMEMTLHHNENGDLVSADYNISFISENETIVFTFKINAENGYELILENVLIFLNSKFIDELIISNNNLDIYVPNYKEIIFYSSYSENKNNYVNIDKNNIYLNGMVLLIGTNIIFKTNLLKFTAINTSSSFTSKSGKDKNLKYISFFNLVGESIENSLVCFNINGSIYSLKTDEKGIGKIYVDLIDDNYILNEIKSGTDSYIKHVILEEYSSHDTIKHYIIDNEFFIKILDDEGIALKNKIVYFEVNGNYYSKLSNENGIVYLNVD